MHDLICRLDGMILGPPSGSAPVVSPEPAEPAPAPELLEALERLGQFGHFHGVGSSPLALFHAVAAAAVEVLGADYGSLLLKNAQGGLDPVWTIPDGPISQLAPETRRAISAATSAARPLSSESPPTLAAPLIKRRNVEPGEDRRRIVRPLEDDFLGAIVVQRKAPFGAADEAVALAFVQHAVTALVRDEHLRSAVIDPLTEAFSRPQLSREIVRLQSRFEGARVAFALLLIDVDGFNAVNEEYGHAVADETLSATAGLMRRTLRDGDLLFRYGGDTFAVLLPETDMGGAEIVAEKLRGVIADHPYRGGRVSLTASVGIAACPLHADQGHELNLRADQALRAAKDQGRNRSVAWSQGIGRSAPRHDALAGILTGDFAVDYRQVGTLLDTFTNLGRAEDQDELLRLAVDRVLAVTDTERAAIMLLAEDGGLVTVVARSRRGEDLKLDERFSRSVPERVLRTGEASAIVVDPKDTETSESLVSLDLASVLCAPLSTPSGLIGVLYADGRAIRAEAEEGRLPFFCALASYIGVAVENARLRARLAGGERS